MKNIYDVNCLGNNQHFSVISIILTDIYIYTYQLLFVLNYRCTDSIRLQRYCSINYDNQCFYLQQFCTLFFSSLFFFFFFLTVNCLTAKLNQKPLYCFTDEKKKQRHQYHHLQYSVKHKICKIFYRITKIYSILVLK